MNRPPLRAAVVAGTCALALSFISLPAQAATLAASSTSGFSAAARHGGDDATEQQSDDSTGQQADDGTDQQSDDTADQQDDSGVVQSADDATDQQGDDAADQQDGDPSALPAEQGSPQQDFRATVLLPKELATRGLKVRYSGLTPKAHYQPYYATGQVGGGFGKERKANGEGVLVLTIRPGHDLAWMQDLGADFTIGLRGVDTALDLQQRIQVKYGSTVALTTERHGGKVVLTASAERETESGDDAPWKKVRVLLQKKVGTSWTTVRTLRTDRHGRASAEVRSEKARWRAVVASTARIAGTTTRSHRR